MGADDKLLRACVKLVQAANKQADALLPGKISGIVKTHATLGVASAFIPVPGVDIAAGIAVIWGMYFRINSELNMPFSENVIKSVATGVGTNLAAFATVLAVGSAFKFLPVIGTVTAIAIMSAASYALTLASGYVYITVLTELVRTKAPEDITESDFKIVVDEVMNDKLALKAFMADARKSYKK